MRRPTISLSRTLAALAVTALLGSGAHSAMASPAAFPCSGSSYTGLTCPVGPSGNAYCDTQCKRDFGPDSTGECWADPSGQAPGCCLCLI